MSGEIFNDAMQMAREALICDNRVAFEAAIERAQAEVTHNPVIAQQLQQATQEFPAPECLLSLASACMIVAHVEFNGTPYYS